MWLLLFILSTATALYLWHVDRAIKTTPPEAKKICQKDWTKQYVKEAYQKVQKSPTDVKPFLFAKKNRRYVVAGGSGLVGGWIVHHLMMRGEDPAAIRIIDLAPTKREEAVQANIDCIQTDVTDPDAVTKAFQKPWPDHVKALPLTVFHTVAYINPSERKPEFLPIYIKINVNGTENVLKAAQKAGASCFIVTSSASVSITPPSYFPWPWQRWPKDIYQFRPNADRPSLTGPLEQFGSCYAYAKARAEHLVCSANSPATNFLTGAIRPAHAIYGHGVDNPSSITWDYLRRGGTPTWIENTAAHFVNAQNVSIAHLAYETALLDNTSRGGKGYCVTDPNPPIFYNSLYTLLTQLAHPLTPVKFPRVPHVFMLFLGHAVELYSLVQFRYFPSLLPKVTGDLRYATPATLQMCALHFVVTDTAAREEIGYRAPVTTVEGLCLAVADWNRRVEEKVKREVEAGRAGEVQVQSGKSMPVLPNVH